MSLLLPSSLNTDVVFFVDFICFVTESVCGDVLSVDVACFVVDVFACDPGTEWVCGDVFSVAVACFVVDVFACDPGTESVCDDVFSVDVVCVVTTGIGILLSTYTMLTGLLNFTDGFTSDVTFVVNFSFHILL